MYLVTTWHWHCHCGVMAKQLFQNNKTVVSKRQNTCFKWQDSCFKMTKQLSKMTKQLFQNENNFQNDKTIVSKKKAPSPPRVTILGMVSRAWMSTNCYLNYMALSIFKFLGFLCIFWVLKKKSRRGEISFNGLITIKIGLLLLGHDGTNVFRFCVWWSHRVALLEYLRENSLNIQHSIFSTDNNQSIA